MAETVADPDFAAFLVDAKLHTHAAQGDAVTVMPLLPGSRHLEYRQGRLLYRDIYFGGSYFVGQETVYQDSTFLWATSYSGGVTDAHTAAGASGETELRTTPNGVFGLKVS